MNYISRLKYKLVKVEKASEQTYQRMKVKYRLYNEDHNIAGKIKDKNCLTQEEVKKVKAYFAPYFNVKTTSHVFYKEKTGEFHINYIPDYIWYGYIDPYFNNWKLDRYLDNKCYYHRIFPQVLMPYLYYYRLNGYWFDGNNKIINKEDVIDFLKCTVEDCFLKMADSLSGCGYGVTYYNPQKGCFHDIEHLFYTHDDMVIQRAIVQHPLISEINNSSVNTIRVLSLLNKNGQVRILSSVLRIGRNGKKVDNASSGGITCGITDDGKLRRYAYSQKGERFTRHPDSHFVFEGTAIPNYQSVLAMVQEIAPTVPHFRLVSWDIAINEKSQPVFIEMNPAYGELDFHQLNNGPVFKEDTIAILDEVFKKRG